MDDEPMVLGSFAVMLRKHFEVLTAGDGRAALELLAKDSAFSAIVSDYRMPGMDGATLLVNVRARYPAIVRLLLTGAGAEGNALTADPDLVFRLLSKPCRRDMLIQTLGEAVALGSAPTAA